jgi:hypothetical protein
MSIVDMSLLLLNPETDFAILGGKCTGEFELEDSMRKPTWSQIWNRKCVEGQ